MKFCTKCGKEIMDEAVICPNCGCATESASGVNSGNDSEDQASVALCILSVLIPLFGIIYWPINHKKTPKKALACGIAAIVSWAIYFSILLFI